jgi:thioredoxin reductase
VVIERRTRGPLVPFSIFRLPVLRAANVIMLLTGAAVLSLFFVLSLYEQQVLHYSALQAGLSQLPLAVTIIAAAGLASRMVSRAGLKPALLTGLVLFAAGLAWLAQVTDTSSFTAGILGPSLLIGAGLGLAFVALTIGSMTGTAPREAGLASGLINSSQQVGGGQAGSSSLIRNYLGFPRGISGASLATRAFEQAWSFGAIPSMAGPVTALQPAADGVTLRLAGGRACHARSVLIATGVSYRRLDAPGLDSLLGTGVFYGATASESTAFAGEHVYIAGGANSAGQAAVNLARYAQQVTIVVRGDSLAARMSQYLIDQITAMPNIDVRTSTQIAAAAGTGKLETLTLTDTKTGTTQTVPASALVVLIGAVPHTGWLPAQIRRDEHGFILTGSDLSQDGHPAARWTLTRPPRPLETSMPGVFTAGDVRHGSVKRVASAVGEGSIAATQMTQYLQEQTRNS